MIKHGEITINKYYDGDIITTIQEVESEQFTDKEYLLRDIIEGLAVITKGQSKKLTIEICLDKRDRYKLTQRWRVQ